jgi:septal ring factor EnvC (AmiA/AmiB activator)
MATTTYLAFWVLVTGIGIGTGALLWWIRREIRRIDMRIDGHDTFVSETSTTIADMRTDIAVLRKSVENIEADGKETKTSIAEINRTLRDRLTGR